VSVDTQDDTFGNDEKNASTTAPKTPITPSFANFDAKFDFAADFSSSNFGEPVKSDPKEKKVSKEQEGGFCADFSSAFSTDHSPFDTGADFFG